MRRTVVGVIAVVTASSVFSLTGLSLAGATTMAPSPVAATAGFSPTDEATALRALHDALESQWNDGNAVGMQAIQAQLGTELAKLQAPQAGRTAMAPDAVAAADKARQENTQLGHALDALVAAHGKSAGDLPVPGLGSLTSLIQSLLATLLSLITGLLGGLPVPVPPLPVAPPHAAS
jgi:hypothetical protein